MNKSDLLRGGTYTAPSLEELDVRVESGFAVTGDYSKPGSASWVDYGEEENNMGDF